MAPLVAICDFLRRLPYSILHDSRALGPGTGRRTPWLLQLLSDGPHFMRQSTVVANSVLQMALLDGNSLNIAGSIAHGSTMRVFRAANGGNLTHRGCLLTHSLQSDASLVEEISPAVFTEGTTQNNPALSPNFVPTPASIALDGCSTGRGGGGLDFFSQNRNIELLGVINFPFPNLEPGSYFVGLGAIELRDLGPIFKDGFEGP